MRVAWVAFRPACFCLVVSALIGARTAVAQIAGQQANAIQRPAGQPALSTEVRLAIASAARKLQELRGVDDAAKRKEIAEAAKALLRPFYRDPTLEDVEAWRLLGVISLVLEDRNLGALAFVEIERLKPNYLDDDRLSDLMVELNVKGAGNLAEYTKTMRKYIISNIHILNNTKKGLHFHLGQGVPCDFRIARDCYETALAADEGEIARRNLAIFLRQGLGGPRDIDRAVDLMSSLAESADDGTSLGAMELLAETLLDSNFGLNAYGKGLETAKRGALKGSRDCTAWVGWCYENGKGVSKDLEQAKTWYRKASDMGNEWARSRLASLSK